MLVAKRLIASTVGRLYLSTIKYTKNRTLSKTKDTFEVDGVVTESLPNTMFRVQVADSGPEEIAGTVILCTLSGKMRMYRIKVMPGDSVKCEVSRYDINRGRITYRSK